MKTTLKTAAALALALTLALPALAGNKGVAPPAPTTTATSPTAPPVAGNRDEIRARVQGKIQAYLTQELNKRLTLDPAKSAKLSDAIKSHMGRKHERMKRLHEEMQKLQGLVDSKASDAQVKAQLDTVLGASSRDDDIQAFVAETQKFLSVQEQAKLALALPDVLRDVHKMMKQARREMHGGGFGGKRANGGDED